MTHPANGSPKATTAHKKKQPPVPTTWAAAKETSRCKQGADIYLCRAEAKKANKWAEGVFMPTNIPRTYRWELAYCCWKHRLVWVRVQSMGLWRNRHWYILQILRAQRQEQQTNLHRGYCKDMVLRKQARQRKQRGMQAKRETVWNLENKRNGKKPRTCC